MFKKIWERFVDTKIIPYVFTCPKHPLRFIELLKANKAFIDGLDPTMTIPGIKLSLFRLYISYFVLWNIVLIPLSMIFHPFLAKLDCHLAIVLAIIFTFLFFGSLQILKNWLIERVAQKIIKRAWKNHFNYFDYEKYRFTVADLYAEAIDRDIPKHQLERFIMDRLAHS